MRALLSVPALLAAATRAAGLFVLAAPPRDGARGRAAAPVTVATSLGMVHGACDGGVCRWLNVPFADPFARFEASRPKSSPYPSGGVGGTTFGPACAQLTWGWPGVDFGSESEDCLQLNIWAPAGASPGSLPTMVWVYGGAFMVGSAGQKDINGTTAHYDGARLASHGVVVISVQYRLGILGFLQRGDGGGGANGIGDQLTALRWVRSHIRAFGGDSQSVTVFGESAGGVSVCILAHIPAARGLFRRVIDQSGTCYPQLASPVSASAAKAARAFYLQSMGVTDHYLRTASAAELLNITMAKYIGLINCGLPSPDGDILPDLPVNLPPLPVDMLVGITAGENQPSSFPNGSLAFFAPYIGADAAAILSHYGKGVRPRDIANDACIQCQSAWLARRFARDHSRVYYYVYDYPHDPTPCHGQDVPAVFGNGGTSMVPSPDRLPPPAIVQTVQEVFTQFAKTGSPGISDWPTVHGDGPVQGMTLGKEMKVLTVESAACAGWVPALDRIGSAMVSQMCMQILYIPGPCS